MTLLFSHIRTGQWASVMPAHAVETMGLGDVVRAIPLVEPDVSHSIGLVVPERQTMSPLAAALFGEALQAFPGFKRR